MSFLSYDLDPSSFLTALAKVDRLVKSFSSGKYMTNGHHTVQQKMLRLLSDGYMHSAKELHNCLYDEEGESKNIHYHLTKIRKALRPKGQTIAFYQIDGKGYYQHVRQHVITDE